MSTLEAWTAADEAALREMIARRDAVTQRRRAAVSEAVDKFFYRGIDIDAVVDALIEHAETVRDALKPFDSGTRVADPAVGWGGACGATASPGGTGVPRSGGTS